MQKRRSSKGEMAIDGVQTRDIPRTTQVQKQRNELGRLGNNCPLLSFLAANIPHSKSLTSL